MNTSLVAIAYVTLGMFIAAMLVPPGSRIPESIRAYALWACATPIVFLVQDQLTVIFVVMLVSLMLAPWSPASRVGFFLVTVPAVPHMFEGFIPFPGINYLTVATHYKLASLAILLPAFLQGSKGAPRQSWMIADVFLIVYVFYTSIRFGLVNSPTMAMRALLDQALILLLPYFAITRCIRTLDDLNKVGRSLVAVSAILAGIAALATLKQWDFYVIVRPSSASMVDFRGGFIRLELTANTHSLGYCFVIGLVCLEILKSHIGMAGLRLYALRILLFAGLYFTESRGAWIGLATTFLFYTSFMSRQTWRLVVLGLGGVVGLIGFGAWLALSPPIVDAYGTIAYRQVLLTTGLAYMAKYPIFGDMLYTDGGAFEHLRQGQGIIDITNFYLQVGLPFGLLGLTLLLSIFVQPALRLTRELLRKRPTTETEGGILVRRWQAGYLSAMTGWLVYAATTSDVALTMHAGILLAALTRAALAARLGPETSASRSVHPARPPVFARPTPAHLAAGRVSPSTAPIR
ncbi:MAG: O-antigen ligase family protein [Hyphomicrobium sp.]